MTTLNLTANGKPQELILAYLQENASEVLAEKINKGTPIEKDGKQLINKKSLDGFMTFASDEAKKLAEKSARSACIEDSVVYGWAIHYFEEDSIEGKLFNEDGTEYKPIVKTAPKTTTPVKVEPPQPKQQQTSLWDMITTEEKKTVTEQANDQEPMNNAESDDEENLNGNYAQNALAEEIGDPTIDEIADALEQAVAEKNNKPIQAPKPYPQFYAEYLELQEHYPEHIVLTRLGDFYEAFDSDAKLLADELNMTLTSRKLTDDERIPIIGFPYHAADNYIAKIRTNHDVIITENGNITALAKLIKTDGKTIDTNTGEVTDDEEIEELTEQEMREFDGDIQEPKTMDEPTENTEQDSTITPESFDEETAIYLLKLLDGKMALA